MLNKFFKAIGIYTFCIGVYKILDVLAKVIEKGLTDKNIKERVKEQIHTWAESDYDDDEEEDHKKLDRIGF